MFPYRATEPNTLGQVTKWDIPINRWLDVKFEQGLNDRGGAALARMAEDFHADGPEISADEANKHYGLPTLKFDSPIKEERARLMHERKRAELTRLAYMESATHSWFSAKATAGFGAQMFGSLLHPVDVGLMFVPVVGSAAKAGGVAKLGGGALRRGLARGLITEESLAVATSFPKFSAAFIEGSVGNALAEIPLFIQNTRDQAIYGPEDAAINILAGGLFASGIRLGLSGLGRGLQAAAFVHRSLSHELQGFMVHKAVDDFVRGKDIRVDELVHVDEAVIRGRVQWDASTIRESIEKHVDEILPGLRQQVAEKYRGERVAFAAIRDESGSVYQGPFHAAILELIPMASRNGLEQGFTTTAGRFLSREEAGDLAGLNRPIDTTSAMAKRYELEALKAKPEPDEREVHRLTAELHDLAELHNPIELSEDAFFSQLHVRDAMRRLQTEAVEQFVAKKRAEFEAQKGSLIEAERQAEVQRQIAAGKILPDEEVERVQLKGETADSNDAAIISEDLASIEQELKADTERRVRDLTPEERELIQRQLDDELGQVEEKAYKPRDKAIQAAVPCVMDGLT